MNNHRRSRPFLGAVVWLLSMGVAFAHLSDTNSYPPLSYSGIPVGSGQTYTDAIFGTPVKRLSDAFRSPQSGVSLPFVMTEYATVAPFNQDNSRLILQHGSYFGLHDGAGNFIRLLPAAISASSEPRWSRSNARVLYFVSGNRLSQHNVDSGATSVVHTFSEYGSISGKGESDICFDGDHFVFVGDNREVFVYEISTGRKGAVLNTGGRGIDSVYITPGDQVTITWLQAGNGRYNGIELFDRDMRFQRQLARAGGHMDVGRDADGQGVLLWANAADPAPVCDNGVVKIRLSDANQTCLVTFNWNLAVNVAATDNSGWVYVATYAPGDPDPLNGAWPTYTNEILQVRLDGSAVRRLAHHRSRPLNGYNYTPRPSVSRDGTKMVFSSNFGMQQSGYPTEYADAYLIDGLSSAGTAGGGGDDGGGGTDPGDGGGGDDGGGSPAPQPPPGGVTRVEEDGAGVTFEGTWFDNGSAGHSAARAKLAMDPGARVTFNFVGTGASWIAYRDEWSGIGEVYVDGSFVDSVDTYATPAQAQAVMYTVQGLTSGAHKLEIRATGRRSGASGGSWIWVDAFDQIAGGTTSGGDGGDGGGDGGGDDGGGGGGGGGPTGATVLIEENDPRIGFTPGWHANNSSVHSGGRAVLSMEAGARATLDFNGTAVTWLAYRDEWSGIARVYLDGQLVAEVDTYAAPVAASGLHSQSLRRSQGSSAQSRMYAISGLPAGDHQLVIEATAQRNPASGGSWIWVDAFEVVQ